MIQIKDQKKFNQVEDYDVSDLRWRGTNAKNECLGYIGTVQINDKTYTGEHSNTDYLEEFGFILNFFSIR